MASMTDYLRDKIRDHVLLNTPYTSPTTVYLAAYTTATTAAGGGTEVTGGSYARQACAFSAGAVGTGSATSTAGETFSNMPGVTVVNLALLDASTGGNMLLHGPMTAPKTVPVGEDFIVNAGDVTAVFG
jgi:hypothetical protein